MPHRRSETKIPSIQNGIFPNLSELTVQNCDRSYSVRRGRHLFLIRRFVSGLWGEPGEHPHRHMENMETLWRRARPGVEPATSTDHCAFALTLKLNHFYLMWDQLFSWLPQSNESQKNEMLNKLFCIKSFPSFTITNTCSCWWTFHHWTGIKG